ncbi:hypothetical protein LX66_3755 [Chitinophaga japonensis]|uniref:Uncharacterized protein n=1 Tax=Chitinophaga japonensis TaxID=104662 RepID=A0A562SYW3_CHIJA|nr:hypothetical protein LX66_3755 [Chitinophaga japonensis]
MILISCFIHHTFYIILHTSYFRLLIIQTVLFFKKVGYAGKFFYGLTYTSMVAFVGRRGARNWSTCR